MIKSHVLYQLSYGPLTAYPSAKVELFSEMQGAGEDTWLRWGCSGA